MLKKKGLIARIDDRGVYTLYVSSEWATLNDENKSKIIENTAFALKYFGNNPNLIIKDNASGKVLVETGKNGIVVYQ